MIKFFQFLENTLAFTALVGIVIVSAMSVMLLNPHAVDTPESDASVAGITTEDQVTVDIVYDHPDYIERIVESTQESTLEIIANKISLGTILNAFATIDNDSIESKEIEISTAFHGYGFNDITAFVKDQFGNETIIFSDAIQSEVITIPAQTELQLDLHLTAKQAINYPVKFVITLEK